MNLPTILVSAVLLIILAAIVRGAVRAKKKGRSFCGCASGCSGGSCSACSGCCSSPTTPADEL